MSDDVAEQQERPGRFVTGGKPGPGRPKGSRNKFANLFIDQFYQHWQEATAEGLEKGWDAIERVWKDEPTNYLKIAAGILPQKVEIEKTDNMTTDERAARIRELVELYGAAALGLAGSAGADRGGNQASRPDKAIPLPTIQ